jgi:hypothetical protein
LVIAPKFADQAMESNRIQSRKHLKHAALAGKSRFGNNVGHPKFGAGLM